MVQSKTRFTSIEEYAALDTSELPECPYELVDGVIVEMGAENLQNIDIAMAIVFALGEFVAHALIHRGTEIEVVSASVKSRFPDVVVLTDQCKAMMKRDKRSLVTLKMPNPTLVVEVVSPGEPGESNYQRDYIDKRREYAERGIPEYWLIDPNRDVVMVMRLHESAYQVTEFRGNELVISPTFPELQLTAEQILNAGQ
jgi:Uma2 family endonuclease